MCRARRLSTRRLGVFAGDRLRLGGPRKRAPGFRVFGLVLILGGFTVVASAGLIGIHLLSTALAPPAPAGPLALHVVIDSTHGIDSVLPLNLTVPAGTWITFYLSNYDTVAVGAPVSDAGLQGAFLGHVELLGAGAGGATPYSGLAPSAVSHTFTMLSGPYDFNVPLPAAASVDAPATVVFTLAFDTTGTFAWYCAAFCDDGGLGGSGPMGGTVTVV